jgi:PAS domain S-box-containing protein
MKQPPANFRKKHRWSRRGLLAGAVSLHLLLAGRGFALDPAKDVLQYNCQTWSRQNGLPVSGIKAIAQTKDGYLWFGSSAGLVRFDGIEFKLFDFHSVANVQNSGVTSLSSARSGGLWVGLENSAFGFYDGQSFSLRSRKNAETAVQNVGSILEAKDGTVWLAAQELAGRLNRSGELEPVLKSDSATNLFLNVLCGYEDRHGRLWFGTTDQGVYCWQDGKITKLPDPELDATLVLCIAEDVEGQIWVGTSDGLRCYDANLKRREIPQLWEEVRALLVDRQGVLWIGTSGRGLVRYHKGSYDVLRKTDGLASDYVKAIAEDQEGSLWVGTRDGISQISDVKFPIQPVAGNLEIKDALSVGASHRGGVWITSSGGVNYFDPQAKTYTPQSGLPNSYSKRVFEARNGDLYVVSGGSTLVVFSGGKAVATNSAPSMVVGLAEDEQGVVVSVGGELYRAGTNYFRPYTFKNDEKPLFYWIVNLASGRDGVIWVACGNGIFRVKDGACQHWSAAEGLSDPNVQWVCEDQDGVVWAGLLSGIVRLKDNHIRLINRKNGLFDDNIYAIVPDDLGNLWVDSGRGIFRVARQTMNDFADGKTDSVECMIFDGIESVKVADKTMQERVGCKTADGRIWFPSPLGVVMIDPAHIPVNRFAPQVHIERVRVNGKEVGRNDHAVVPPGKGELEFHYNALSFIAPQKARFRYRLEGYDKDWVDAGERRMAFYTNLKPGSYTFRVIAANADGVWTETGDSLELELRPHFYQTIWFYLLCGVGAFATLIGGYLRRIRRLKSKQRALQKNHDLLESKVQERTSELRNEIAERKRAEEALRRSETKFRTLYDSTSDAVMLLDEKGFFDCNLATLAMFGCATREEFCSKHPTDVSPPVQPDGRDSLTLAKQHMATAMEKGSHYFEWLHKRADTGETFPGEVLLNAMELDGKRVLQATVRDITERKRAEESSRASQQLVEGIINAIPVRVFWKDKNLVYLGCNAVFARDAGFAEPKDLIGKDDYQMGWRDQAELYRAGDRQVIESGCPRPLVEEPQTTPEGNTIILLTSKIPLRDSNGEVSGMIGTSMDVTDRRQAEAALVETSALLEALLQNTTDDIYFKDLQSRFVHFSRQMLELFHLTQSDELKGKTDFDFFSEEHARPAFEAEQEIIRTGKPLLNVEEKETHRDGRVSWALTSKMAWRDQAGNVIGTMGISKDITERKQTEQALASSFSLLQATLESTADGLLVVDQIGQIVQFNQKFVEMWRIPADILASHDDRRAIAFVLEQLEDPGGFVAKVKELYAQPEAMSFDVLEFKDGRTFERYSQPQKVGGKGVGRVWSFRDITERKRAEAALVETSALLEALLQNTTDKIYFKDLQSRFVRFSQQCLEVFHLTQPAELQGKTDFDFFSEEHARPAFEAEQEIIRTGKPIFNLEEKETHRDGRVSWALTSKMAWRDQAGNVIGTMGISRDITGRKRMEEQLFQSQKMETVGKLAGGVAHEFNSILTAIICQSELLLEDLPAGSPLAENATEIRSAAERAAVLTRQLLAYGRKQFLQPEILDLNAVLAGLASALRHLLGPGADVRLAPAAGLKAVKADAGQLEQVIMNLAMNARDAMPNGGKLTLETAAATLDEEYVSRYPELKAGKYVMLAITDTGMGMSEEVKARVFEPFFTTKDVGQGTGLGLSTCYGILKQSGGHISVYSEPGRGTTFKIYLPQVEPLAKNPLQRLASPDLPRGTETILLVEDDPALREMAATLLRRLGYTVLAAANGVEALSLSHQPDTGRIDLLFTDVVMPHMSGKELADRVRALSPHTRILFTSGYTENTIVQQGGLNQGVAFLQKPFTPSVLARKVREVLDAPGVPQPDFRAENI